MNVLTAIKPNELMVKIVHDELAALMGNEHTELNLKGSPAVVLMSGLQGSGKTTFSGKLANMLKSKRGRHPLLVACDVYRRVNNHPDARNILQKHIEDRIALFIPYTARMFSGVRMSATGP